MRVWKDIFKCPDGTLNKIPDIWMCRWGGSRMFCTSVWKALFAYGEWSQHAAALYCPKDPAHPRIAPLLVLLMFPLSNTAGD